MIMGNWDLALIWGGARSRSVISGASDISVLRANNLIFFFTPTATMSLPPQVTLLHLGSAQITAGSHFPIIIHHGPGNTDIFPYSYLPVRGTLWTLRDPFSNITLCTISIGLNWFGLLAMTTLPMEQRPSIHCTGAWAGPRVGPHTYRKSHPPRGSNLRPSSP
jgi:hypothetical protein